MIAAETSYVPGGSFFDMKKGVARQDHVKSWWRRGPGGGFGSQIHDGVQ